MVVVVVVVHWKKVAAFWQELVVVPESLRVVGAYLKQVAAIQPE
jgi:hypothetical protein